LEWPGASAAARAVVLQYDHLGAASAQLGAIGKEAYTLKEPQKEGVVPLKH
jgi:hypothetical protein